MDLLQEVDVNRPVAACYHLWPGVAHAQIERLICSNVNEG